MIIHTHKLHKTFRRFEKDPDVLVSLYQNGYDDTLGRKERLLGFLRGCEGVKLEGE